METTQEVKQGAMTKSDVIREYLRKFPKISTAQLARKLIAEHPLRFSENYDSTRHMVRYVRGAAGKELRQIKLIGEYMRDPKEAEALIANPFGLPESHADEWKPMEFPLKKGRCLVLADMHIPFHDIEALTLAMQWGKKNKYTDGVLLLGDVNDYYALSKFDKDPTVKGARWEMEATNLFLDSIQKNFPKAQIIFRQGNHDFRFYNYLRAKAPMIFDMADFLWNTYLGIERRGIIAVENDIPMTIGKLNIIHGHELKGTSTVVNPARGAYLKAMECVMLGHWHRTSQHSEMSFSRRFDSAWSVGCTCCLWPEYARVNKWNHGVAGIEIDGKDFEIENKRIFGGMVR